MNKPLIITGQYMTAAARALEKEQPGEGYALVRMMLKDAQRGQIEDLLDGKLVLNGDSEKGVEFVDVRHNP